MKPMKQRRAEAYARRGINRERYIKLLAGTKPETPEHEFLTAKLARCEADMAALRARGVSV